MEIKADALAAEIPAADRKELRRGDKRQWSFTCTVQIPNVNHKVRIVILWKQRRDAEPCKILVTNRITWEVSRILGVYRYRWTGTETFHRDGQQELGLGDCQLRDGQGQTRHMYLVMLAYSLLVRQLGQNRAQDWALQKLTTIGEACRAMLRETLRTTGLGHPTSHRKIQHLRACRHQTRSKKSRTKFHKLLLASLEFNLQRLFFGLGRTIVKYDWKPKTFAAPYDWWPIRLPANLLKELHFQES